VEKLASAIAEVSAAQHVWLADIDLASRRPATMKDAEWRSRTEGSMRSLLAAANGLRIDPVPESLQVIDLRSAAPRMKPSWRPTATWRRWNR
jgi:hypothetical protein